MLSDGISSEKGRVPEKVDVSMKSQDSRHSPFKLWLFGDVYVECKGERVHVSPTQLTFLFILAVKGPDGATREELKHWIWPSGTDHALSHRLTQLLYSTRARLGTGDILSSNATRVALNPQFISTELEDFERALRDNRLHDALQLLEARLSVTHRAATHDLQTQLLDPLNRRLKADLEARAHELWQSATKETDWESAELAARVLQSLHPEDEETLVQLAISIGMKGRFSEASGVIRAFCRERENDSAWSPSPRLTRICEAVRNGAPPINRPPILRSDTLLPFIGREEELDQLRSLLLWPSPGRNGIVLVSGEEGVGKSRLCEELIKEIPLSGPSVLAAYCHGIEQRVPLLPIVEALRAPWVSRKINALKEPWRSTLRGVIESRTVAPSDSTSAPISNSRPRAILESLRNLFAALAREQPVIIYLDDVGNADSATLEALHYLVRNEVSDRLRVLATARTAPEQMPSLQEPGVPSFLRSALPIHDFHLDPLSTDDALLLADALADKHSLPEKSSELVAMAGTVPIFLIEAARHWDHLNEPAGFPMPHVPPMLIQVLRRRMSMLEEVELHALDLICVAGHPLATHILCRVLGHSELRMTDVLDRLTLQGLITVEERGLKPRLPLIRRIVLSRRSAAGLAALHSEIAIALEAVEDTPAGVLAEHFAAASYSEKAVRYAMVAAQTALARGAFEQASHFFSLAAKHCDSDEERRTAIGQLGMLQHHRGNFDEAIPHLALSEELHLATGTPEVALLHRIYRQEAEVAAGDYTPEEANDILMELHRAARSAGWPQIAAEALDVGIRIQRRLGGIPQIERIIRAGKELWNLSPCRSVRASTASLIALSAYFGAPSDGPVFADHAVREAEPMDDDSALLKALTRKVAVHLARGDLGCPKGRESLRKAEELAKASADPLDRLHPTLNRFVWHTDSGQAELGRTGLEALADTVERIGSPEVSAVHQCNLGLSCLKLGDFSSAKKHLERAGRAADTQYYGEVQVQVVAGLGLCALEESRYDCAEKSAAQLSLPETWYFDPTTAIRFLVALYRHRGNHSQALELLVDTLDRIHDRFPLYWLDLVIFGATNFRHHPRSSLIRQKWEEAHALANDLQLVRHQSVLRLLAVNSKD